VRIRTAIVVMIAALGLASFRDHLTHWYIIYVYPLSATPCQKVQEWGYNNMMPYCEAPMIDRCPELCEDQD